MAATKHNNIRSKLMDRISSGRYPVNSRIPGYHQLAKEFSVSYLTVSNAIRSLVADGLLACRPGIGVFVSPPPSAPPGKNDAQRKIGFIIPKEGCLNMWPDFFSGMLQELDKDKALAVLVATTEMFDLLGSAEIDSKFRQYSAYGLDSLVVCGTRHFAFRHLKRVEKCFKQLNFVVYNDTDVDFPEANRIVVDFHDIGERVAERLIDFGCKSFVEVTFPLLPEIYAADRGCQLSGYDADILRGVRDYCSANAAEFEKFASVFRNKRGEDIEAEASRLAEALRGVATPVGIFVVGDSRAVSVYMAAEILNWKIGTEIKVIGLYDTAYAKVLNPNLTSFKVDVEPIVQNTLRSLRENWSGRTLSCKAILTERESG